MTTAAVPPTYVDANRLWVDSRLRYELGRRLEAQGLQRLGARGTRAVDLGTGRRGLGARAAVELFGASEVDAYDLYDDSVARARTRLLDLGDRVRVHRGDAGSLPLATGSVDLVVCFHALHHMQDWRAGVAEAARLLRPGGLFAFAEMTSKFIDARWLRAVSRHPADRFGTDQLVAELRAQGLEVGDRLERRLGDRWLLGVATRD